MTNKENLKKSINNDFNKEKNYNEIIQKIEGESMKNKNKFWRWSLVPICLIVVISGVLFINFQNKGIILENYNDKENNIILNINDLENIGATRLDADIKDIPTNGLNVLWLEILNDIKLPNDLDKVNSHAIYTRKDKTTNEYTVLNCYVYNYFNESDDNKSIRIAFSDTNKPIRDYYFDDEKSQETVINNTKLTIFKYNTLYFTEFSYKGYNFDIETTNISEQEFSNLLVSIIK